MRCTQTVEAGAYVLGALSPAERSMYQRHVAACDDCRNEVADLAGLPGLLGRLDEAAAVALDTLDPVPATDLPVVPRAILTQVLDKARVERTRTRYRQRWRAASLGVAAACLAMMAGVGVTTSLVARTPAPAPILASMDALAPNEPITAVIGFSKADDGGTDLQMSCLYADSDSNSNKWGFELIVYARSGAQELASQWMAGPGDYRKITAHSRYAPSDIARIEVDLANGTRLLKYEMT